MLFSRTAEDFLISHGIHPDQIDMEKLCQQFLGEMERGLRGEPSSLAMLATYVAVKEDIPKEKPVLVLDAGGTNFRACLVEFDQAGNSHISRYGKYRMPGSEGELTKKDFFGTIAEFAAPLAEHTDTVGFCFSYPTESTPERDGKVLHFSKEVQAQEVIGELVGENVRRELKKLLPDHDWNFCILNDTAATLLAGKIASKEDSYSGYIGFILGTGTNTSYVESSGRIGKIPRESFDGDNQIINVESGGFAVDLSDLDMQFYQKTKNPDSYHFEKIVSGAYLGPYILHVLKQAAREGIFSERTRNAVESLESLTTIEMDDLLHTPDEPSVLHDVCGENQLDRSLMYQIADRMVERAARLSAVNLSAAVLRTDAGMDPTRPVCINADGTTFLKTHHLKKYTQAYLDDFLVDQYNRYYELIHIENSPILGAAIAGLQNR